MVSILTPVSRDNSPIGIPSNLAREAVTGGMLKAPCFCSCYRMHPLAHDDQGRRSRSSCAARTKVHGRRRYARRPRGLVVLHPPAYALLPRRQRSMDWELHAACALSALLHRGDVRIPGIRLLAGLTIEK